MSLETPKVDRALQLGAPRELVDDLTPLGRHWPHLVCATLLLMMLVVNSMSDAPAMLQTVLAPYR